MNRKPKKAKDNNVAELRFINLEPIALIFFNRFNYRFLFIRRGVVRHIAGHLIAEDLPLEQLHAAPAIDRICRPAFGGVGYSYEVCKVHFRGKYTPGNSSALYVAVIVLRLKM